MSTRAILAWPNGQEISILCASLARRGNVGASIHHWDGSSCRAPSHVVGNDCTYYAHLPPAHGGPGDRLRQVHVRAGEFLKARLWLVGGGGGGGGGGDLARDDNDDDDDDVDGGGLRRIVLDQIRPHLDDRCGGTIAAGSSNSTTMAALVAMLEPDEF